MKTNMINNYTSYLERGQHHMVIETHNSSKNDSTAYLVHKVIKHLDSIDIKNLIKKYGYTERQVNYLYY